MAHYGTLRNFQFSGSETAEDVRGSHVYGSGDDKLGKIDDVVFDHSTGDIRYVVIDTGGWLSSKKFVVPADKLRVSEKHEDDFRLDLTKQQIESFPPYDEKDVESQEKWNDYENRYRSKWVDGPVMHRAGTDRNLTPTTQQLTQGSGATGPKNWEKDSPAPAGPQLVDNREIDLDTSMTSTDRTIPATADEVTIENSATGLGGRWLTFESRLRQRRREATRSCTSCTVGSASDRSAESADQQRKAI